MTAEDPNETDGADAERPADEAAQEAAPAPAPDDGAVAASPARPVAIDAEHQRELGAEVDINLEVLLDVPLSLSLVVGRTQVSIRDLLQLNQGSVVELDRSAGEPLDVVVNGTLVAHGEVVVVNDQFGVRLTDVISPAERIRQLQ